MAIKGPVVLDRGMALFKSEMTRLRWSFTSQKKRDTLLKATSDLLRVWPETAELLDLARDLNIGIRFNEAFIGTETDGVFSRNRTTGECHIELKPFKKPEDAAIPLIHELRHLWQDRQLGLQPGKAALADRDAPFALLLSRVKEADAFAFTDLMIARINNAREDLTDSDAFAKSLGPGAELTPEQQEQVDEFLAQRIAARLPGEKEKMEQGFLRALGWMESYDRETLEKYHRRYTDPARETQAHLTEKDGAPLTLAAVRGLLRAGTMVSMPAYLDASDDAAFVQTVMGGLNADVKAVADLIAVFEKAAAKGLPAAEEQRQRLDIDRRVRKALGPG